MVFIQINDSAINDSMNGYLHDCSGPNHGSGSSPVGISQNASHGFLFDSCGCNKPNRPPTLTRAAERLPLSGPSSSDRSSDSIINTAKWGWSPVPLSA